MVNVKILFNRIEQPVRRNHLSIKMIFMVKLFEKNGCYIKLNIEPVRHNRTGRPTRKIFYQNTFTPVNEKLTAMIFRYVLFRFNKPSE